MKRNNIIGLVACICIICFLSACGGSETVQSAQVESEEVKTENLAAEEKADRAGFNDNTNDFLSFAGCRISIPSYYSLDESISDNENKYYYAETGDSLVMLLISRHYVSGMREDVFNTTGKDDFMKGFFGVDDMKGFSVTDTRDLTISKMPGRMVTFEGDIGNLPSSDKTTYFMNENEESIVSVCIFQTSNALFDYFNDYNKIVNSIEKDPVIAENEESIESQAENSDIQEQSIPEEPTVADESSWTREQQNAYKAAKSYLNFLPFSKQGLIEQLSSEYGDQYPEEVAVFAVEQLEERGEVDWYEQAEKCAKSYLEVMDFSRQELIDQLSSEYGDQFTVEQAEAAVEKVY